MVPPDDRDRSGVLAGAALPPELDRDVTPERRALWTVERDLWRPQTHIITDDSGSTVAVALTAARPHTAYRKIVDVIATCSEAFAAVVHACVREASGEPGSDPPLLIVFEEHLALAPLDVAEQEILSGMGFRRAARPAPSVPSTLPGDPSATQRWEYWVAQAPTRTVPYYGQTTDVTCGAVSALTAFAAAGDPVWTVDAAVNQRSELDFWREAMNLPACEPVGLAVAIANRLGDGAGEDRGTAAALSPRGLPEIVLSAAPPVLLEEFAGQEHELRLRTQLQEDSARRAALLGMAIEHRWIDLSEIHARVAAGECALILITLEPLIGDPSPHWVLAFDALGTTTRSADTRCADGRAEDAALVIADPWVEREHGESWADVAALPIRLGDFEQIARWGDPPYCGVVMLPKGEPSLLREV